MKKINRLFSSFLEKAAFGPGASIKDARERREEELKTTTQKMSTGKQLAGTAIGTGLGAFVGNHAFGGKWGTAIGAGVGLLGTAANINKYNKAAEQNKAAQEQRGYSSMIIHRQRNYSVSGIAKYINKTGTVARRDAAKRLKDIRNSGASSEVLGKARDLAERINKGTRSWKFGSDEATNKAIGSLKQLSESIK